jgi:hypothetical protein
LKLGVSSARVDGLDPEARVTTESAGPIAYENWKRFLNGEPSTGAHEVPLFTDSWILGGIEYGTLGPYQLFNTVPMPGSGRELRPTIVLRIEDHLPPNPPLPEIRRTEDAAYHGGGLDDEIAALVSLCLGVRTKAGGRTRVFGLNPDPRGTPISWYHDRTPSLPDSRRILVMPAVAGRHSLGDAERLTTLPNLSLEAAVALVKTARIYQAALWIAELDPSLSWVLLVSAIESAAEQWRSSHGSPVERLTDSHPELRDRLFDRGGEDHVTEIAGLLDKYIGATRKFVEFVDRFLPAPPVARPATPYQFEFEAANVKKALRQIYNFRSQALHAATPFPFPMCEMQAMVGPGTVPAEIPIGLGASTLGATWVKKDMPMMLNTFEHIVRGALLNWWSSNASARSGATGP